MPLELPGKSFGYLPDRRNTVCPRCGRGFRNFALGREGHKPHKRANDNEGLISLICPYCGYELEVVEASALVVVK